MIELSSTDIAAGARTVTVTAYDSDGNSANFSFQADKVASQPAVDCELAALESSPIQAPAGGNATKPKALVASMSAKKTIAIKVGEIGDTDCTITPYVGADAASVNIRLKSFSVSGSDKNKNRMDLSAKGLPKAVGFNSFYITFVKECGDVTTISDPPKKVKIPPTLYKPKNKKKITDFANVLKTKLAKVGSTTSKKK